MKEKEINNRCKALTRAGKACRAAAMAGGLCFFHGNPKKAAELGRIGGRKNRRVVPDAAASLLLLETAIEVKKTTAQLIADVYAGRIDPRIASGLAQLLSLQLRVIETSDLEHRLRAVDRLIKAAEEKENSGHGENPEEKTNVSEEESH